MKNLPAFELFDKLNIEKDLEKNFEKINILSDEQVQELNMQNLLFEIQEMIEEQRRLREADFRELQAQIDEIRNS